MNDSTETPEATEAWHLNYKTIIAIRESKSLTANQKLVLTMLASCGDESWPSQTTLADYTGLSRVTVGKLVKELRAMGAIATDAGHGRGLTYRVSEDSVRSTLAPAANTGEQQLSTRLSTIEKLNSKERDQHAPDLASTSAWKQTHDAVIDRYAKDYKLCTGIEPLIDKRTHKAAWDIAKLLSKEEAVDLVDAAFENDFFRKNQKQLWTIAANINLYRRPIKPPPPTVRFAPRDPNAKTEVVDVESLPSYESLKNGLFRED